MAKSTSSKPSANSAAKKADNAAGSTSPKAENVSTNTSPDAVGTAKAAGVNMPQLDPTDDTNVVPDHSNKTDETGRLVGSPTAPEPTPPTTSDIATDQDQGGVTDANGESDTSAQDKLDEVHPNGQAPDNMPQGGEASTPRTDQPLPKRQASNLDLDGLEKALLKARDTVVVATSKGVRLTRDEFEQHGRVAALAQEVSNSIGNLR